MEFVHGRRLSSSSSYENAVLPTAGPYFSFDGTNLDLARQLYIRAKAGGTATKFTDYAVPDAVQARLDDLNIAWGDLSGIAQRAVLWDSGFGVTLDQKPVQIWTLAGHSMTDPAIPLVQFQAIGCTEMNCTQPDGTESLSNLYCNGEQMLNAARCVMEDFTETVDPHLSMWITGGNPIVLAVHTVDIDNEPAYGECATNPENGGNGSLVLACYTEGNIADNIRGALEDAQGTPWVSRWLVEDYANGSGNSHSTTSTDKVSFKLVYLVPIIVGALVIVGLVVFISRRRNKNADNRSLEEYTSPSPNQIMEKVMAGRLRPNFTKDCPPLIRRISTACCQQDPPKHPTAARVVLMLNGDE